MRHLRKWLLAMTLFSATALAGSLNINGQDHGQLRLITIEYTSVSGLTEKLVIDYSTNPAGDITMTTTSPVPTPSTDLQRSYSSLIALQKFLIYSKYDGTVFVNDRKIRSGRAAPVYFRMDRDGSIRQ